MGKKIVLKVQDFVNQVGDKCVFTIGGYVYSRL